MHNNKKLLIITKHFIPFTSSLGGVSRNIALIKFLLQRNFEIFVVTSTGKYNGYFGYKHIINQINIFYIKDRLKESVDKKNTYSAKNNNNNNNPLLYLKLKFGRLFLKFFMLPDYGIFMLPFYFVNIIRIINTKKINKVYISTPPNSSALLIFFIRAFYGTKIKIILDYRDSWNLTKIHQHPIKLVHNFLFFLELKCISLVDYFLYASKPIYQKLLNTKKLSSSFKRKSRYILNGYTKLPNYNSLPTLKINSDKIVNIGYFGTFDDNIEGYRNIFLVLEKIKKLDPSNRFILHIFGTSNCDPRKLKSYNFVNFYGNLNHQLSLNYMAIMDYLLIIHTDPKSSDEVITGKLFDYVASRKPVILFSSAKIEALRLIKVFNLGYWINLNASDGKFMNFLNVLYKNKSKIHKISDDNFILFSRRFQFTKILDILSE